MNKNFKKDDWKMAYGVYSVIGLQLAASVVAGLVLGNYLDKKLGTLPWITLVGVLLGSIGGFYNIVRILNWNNRRMEKKDQ